MSSEIILGVCLVVSVLSNVGLVFVLRTTEYVGGAPKEIAIRKTELEARAIDLQEKRLEMEQANQARQQKILEDRERFQRNMKARAVG